jgi:lipopolysaccharide export system permease protein
MAKFLSISIFTTLVIWGILLLLQKLASGGVVLAEIAIIVPIIFLTILSIILYREYETR